MGIQTKFVKRMKSLNTIKEPFINGNTLVFCLDQTIESEAFEKEGKQMAEGQEWSIRKRQLLIAFLTTHQLAIIVLNLL